MTPPRYIPADILPGVLDGWVGRIEVWRPDSGGTGALRSPGHWHPEISGAVYTHGSSIRLDTHTPATRDHLARVMAEGVKCPMCKGSGVSATIDREACDCDCGTGYLRKPTPIWHILRAEQDGTITAEEAAGAVAWSVLSVARGGDVLRNVLAQPTLDSTGEVWWRHAVTTGVERANWQVSNTPDRGGMNWFFNGECGPETGAEGRACSDRAALAKGFALREPGGTVFPELESAHV